MIIETKKMYYLVFFILLALLCTSCMGDTSHQFKGEALITETSHSCLEVYGAFSINEYLEGQNIIIQTILYVDASVKMKGERGEELEKTTYGTIMEAKQKVRELIKDGLTGAVVVLLREGKYFLEESLVFLAEDSGTEQYPIIYAAYEGEHPVIYGGTQLTDWGVTEHNNIIKTSVDIEDISVLYDEEEFSYVARHPNREQGRDTYYTVAAIGEKYPLRQFYYSIGNFDKLDDVSSLKATIWPGGRSGEWNWVEETFDVVELNKATRQISLHKNASHALGKGTRFYLQGVYSMLDSPREFYYNTQEGVLYYWPKQANLDKVKPILPHGGNIVDFKLLKGKYAHDIRFFGLKFAASANYCDAIYINGAERIEVIQCHFVGIGGSAIRIENFSKSCTIENNLIHEIGGSGIYINGAISTIIRNNHIHHGSRLVGHLAGISVNMGEATIVSNNLIHDMRRSGIDVRNVNNAGTVISYNQIYNVCNDSQDTAPIYTYDAEGPLRIEYNKIHDSNIPFSFGAGIYLDDRSRGITVHGNLLYDLQKENILGRLSTGIVAKGWDNRISNNYLINNRIQSAGDVIATFPQNNSNYNITIDRNLVWHNESGVLFLISSLGEWNKDRYSFIGSNLYYIPNGTYYYKMKDKAIKLKEFRNYGSEMYEEQSLWEDPLLMNVELHDFRLKEDSKANQLGITNLNLQDMGLLASYAFSEKDGLVQNIYAREQGTQLNLSEISIKCNEIINLDIIVRDYKGYVIPLSKSKLKITVDNDSIVKVNSLGAIIGLDTGTTEITITTEQNKKIKYSLMVVVTE